MLLRLAILFLVVPLAELAVLIWVGQWIGLWQTIALVLAISLVGAWLVKRAGVRAFVRIQESLQQGRIPGPELVDGLLVLVAGALLLTPGLLTDALGFLLLTPPLRVLMRRGLIRYFRKRLVVVMPVPTQDNVMDAPWREVREPNRSDGSSEDKTEQV